MLSCSTYPYIHQISLSSVSKGVNDFSFFVGTRVEEETNQLSLAVPIPISPKFGYPLNIGVNNFASFVGTRVADETNQLCIVHACTNIGVRNSNI